MQKLKWISLGTLHQIRNLLRFFKVHEAMAFGFATGGKGKRVGDFEVALFVIFAMIGVASVLSKLTKNA